MENCSLLSVLLNLEQEWHCNFFEIFEILIQKNQYQIVPHTTSWLSKGDCNNFWKPKQKRSLQA